MSTGTDLERRVRRVGVGTVELLAEPRLDGSLETLKANLQNRVCVLLMLILLAAQAADIATTYRALANNRYVEENPLFSVLLSRSPLAAYTVKLLTIGWLMLFAMSNLRGRRIVAGLGIAAALSLTAPLLNFALLLRG
ncbi:MAG: hypothetical protein JF887_11865 [Candidatus Dormibacteraeota bacterium]|uniref:DUF5658 domain-containing protein n=1 Tax=Candidatus Amunia macphersoniae TaxID=3127014 RepID=A0A934KGF8_9BACT|nr:hypothetical protein [Candidatus Dormibacteraeota bacterium]